MTFSVFSIYLKPRVKALLDLPIHERGPHWLEELAAATFDLDSWEQVSPEQRTVTKQLHYAALYGMGAMRMIEAFAVMADTAEAADQAIAEWHRLMRGTPLERRSLQPTVNPEYDQFIARCAQDVKFTKRPSRSRKQVRQSSKTGAIWPKPKGSY